MSSGEEKHSEPKLSVSAVIGLVIAIIALLIAAIPIVNNFAFVLAIVALILGIVGYSSTKKGKAKGRKMSIVSIVLAVLAGAVVLMSQAFYGNVLDEASEKLDESVETMTGERTEELLENEVDVELGEFQVTEEEFTTETQLPVTVTNKAEETYSFTIQIEAVNEDGSRITDDSIYVNNLGANQTQEFKAFEFIRSDTVDDMQDATFEIVSVSRH